MPSDIRVYGDLFISLVKCTTFSTAPELSDYFLLYPMNRIPPAQPSTHSRSLANKSKMIKQIVLIAALVASASAFAPTPRWVFVKSFPIVEPAVNWRHCRSSLSTGCNPSACSSGHHTPTLFVCALNPTEDPDLKLKMVETCSTITLSRLHSSRPILLLALI